MIPQDTIMSILDTVRIEEVVGDFVNLKKRGANLIGVCPFHREKTPSFIVSPAKGIFKCFGCGKGGNAYDLNNSGVPREGDSRPLYRYRTDLHGGKLMVHN